MKNEQPVSIYRRDYTPFPYQVLTLHLDFRLFEEQTRVVSRAVYRKKSESNAAEPDLLLYGEQLELAYIKVDGIKLQAEDYSIDERQLRLKYPGDEFELEIETIIYPHKNSALEGLYKSSGNYCSQCEAEGFRKITYYPDRPDVLTTFTTRIEADEQMYPVMLSNGNLLESEKVEGGRHSVIWHDPFPKPSYLFALVAGALVCIEDTFVTGSGREVALKIYVEARNQQKCDHAMRSLKKAMAWDEEVFGLEYDLDIFMIVAVDDFNMGAMENKGLNVFNSKYVLSTPESATDQDYLGIEGVIGHEYFHNWTGNRITCRDWFQLSLKEGLTVFRDQQFSADMNSSDVQRIDDVKILKNVQFKEDSGPMAHPVRPDSFVEINNFYTATVYNKGAEVIRMMHTLLGAENFRKGMELYVKRHDGQAVTCDDFVAAMADASGKDLNQFKNWYSQSGTPVLTVQENWRVKEQTYVLSITQDCPPTPGQKTKESYHMPISIGLLSEKGDNLLPEEKSILELKERQQSYVFANIKERPVLSFLRDFSAPVKVESFQAKKDVIILAQNDPNLFNRWDAMVRLSAEICLELCEKLQGAQAAEVDQTYLDAIDAGLSESETDRALLALCLQLPAETTLAQEMVVVDPDNLHRARKLVELSIAKNSYEKIKDLYLSLHERGEYSISPEAMGKRSLKNICLRYLVAGEPYSDEGLSLCVDQFKGATNMTDSIGALSLLVQVEHPEREKALDDFYQKWQEDPLVLDKWFSMQAVSYLPDCLERVKVLTANKSFSMKNPNKVRSLIGTFCMGNQVRFHDRSGEGYRFAAEKIIELNEFNPQIAARMVSCLIHWRRFDEQRQQLQKAELQRILATANLSKDVFEIAKKTMD